MSTATESITRRESSWQRCSVGSPTSPEFILFLVSLLFFGAWVHGREIGMFLGFLACVCLGTACSYYFVRRNWVAGYLRAFRVDGPSRALLSELLPYHLEIEAGERPITVQAFSLDLACNSYLVKHSYDEYVGHSEYPELDQVLFSDTRTFPLNRYLRAGETLAFEAELAMPDSGRPSREDDGRRIMWEVELRALLDFDGRVEQVDLSFPLAVPADPHWQPEPEAEEARGRAAWLIPLVLLLVFLMSTAAGWVMTLLGLAYWMLRPDPLPPDRYSGEPALRA